MWMAWRAEVMVLEGIFDQLSSCIPQSLACSSLRESLRLIKNFSITHD